MCAREVYVCREQNSTNWIQWRKPNTQIINMIIMSLVITATVKIAEWRRSARMWQTKKLCRKYKCQHKIILALLCGEQWKYSGNRLKLYTSKAVLSFIVRRQKLQDVSNETTMPWVTDNLMYLTFILTFGCRRIVSLDEKLTSMLWWCRITRGLWWPKWASGSS